ncbi:MarR family transcriptional regulator [Natrinema soli]|uniref:MarR family transcriptional regulator n=1 Tax=Natrinema soli TaxID=1930624 RepID=A0ABD5SFA7_9EURY
MPSTSVQQFVIPTDLESPRAKLVSLSLRRTNASTASELRRLLGTSKLALFPLLSSLAGNDYVPGRRTIYLPVRTRPPLRRQIAWRSSARR